MNCLLFMVKMLYPIFFDRLIDLSKEEVEKIPTKILEDLKGLYEIWGRIMHYSTDIENMLKEHLNLENEKMMLGSLIEKFKEDSSAKKHPQLLLDLDKLNKKCRILWAHGFLMYALENGQLVNYLVYTEKDESTGEWSKKKISIGNDYFDQIANVIFPEVIGGLFKMYDKKDLKTKTSFIVPLQKDSGASDFIFVK